MRSKLAAFCLAATLCTVPVFWKVYAANGPTVTVAVVATDPGGFALHYQWKSTDGTITNVNAASTTWVLPNGPGLHFAYVLVSDAHGGYTERRVAVNTDTIGTPPVIPPPVTWAAPSSQGLVGDYYRAWATHGATFVSASVGALPAYVPNAQVFVKDTVGGKRYPATGTILTDVKGQYVIPGLPPGHTFLANCSFDGGTTFVDCTSGPNQTSTHSFSMPPAPETAWTDYVWNFSLTSWPPAQSYNGQLVLQDGNPCGTVNEFFNVHSTGTAALRTSAGATLATETIDEKGVWSLPLKSTAASVLLQCESAAPITITVSPTSGSDSGPSVISTVSDPVVTNMTATLNGGSVGLFLPPPSGFPSDIVPAADAFLEAKGLDSQVGACQYYLAVGAVKTCDASGNPTGAISFEDWKRVVKIDSYATTTEYSATYVNEADLNLSRNHHSVSYGTNQTAAYVCNSLGYAFANNNQFLVPTQAAVDTAVGNSAAGKNLVACVAMDWGITGGVNGSKPFTRFLIFGPSGQLLLSVNLDGRREKYVPGTCVVCHGGDHYAGHFPTDGTGKANVGAHFLPYDEGNFLFSSAAGLTRAAQESSIYHLNQNVLNAGPPTQESELINGWYASGQVQNTAFVPSTWTGRPAPEISFYQNVQAHSCRGCHITAIEQYDWEHRDQMAYLEPATVCYGSGNGWRGHSMPNSLVTLNRFWLSSGNTVGVPDQVKIFNAYPGVPGPQGASCQLQP